MSFCQNFILPLDSEANRDSADAESVLFHCFSLFPLPRLKTLAHEKTSENCLRFSLFVSTNVAKYNIFFPALTRAARAKKIILAKLFAHVIRKHYRDFEHSYGYWIWLRGSASYVITVDSSSTETLHSLIIMQWRGRGRSYIQKPRFLVFTKFQSNGFTTREDNHSRE